MIWFTDLALHWSSLALCSFAIRLDRLGFVLVGIALLHAGIQRMSTLLLAYFPHCQASRNFLKFFLKLFSFPFSFPIPRPTFILLKVLTNEKRGGLNLVAFNWSHCKIFTLKWGNYTFYVWRAAWSLQNRLGRCFARAVLWLIFFYQIKVRSTLADFFMK